MSAAVVIVRYGAGALELTGWGALLWLFTTLAILERGRS